MMTLFPSRLSHLCFWNVYVMTRGHENRRRCVNRLRSVMSHRAKPYRLVDGRCGIVLV